MRARASVCVFVCVYTCACVFVCVYTCVTKETLNHTSQIEISYSINQLGALYAMFFFLSFKNKYSLIVKTQKEN